MEGIFGLALSPSRLLKRTAPALSLNGNLQPDNPLRSEIFTREDLATHARTLAQQHKVSSLKISGKDLFSRFAENCVVIEKAYFAFGRVSAKEHLTPGAEWLLDNYHVVEEHVREIKAHLPKSYYQTLPKIVSEEFLGYPRVYHLAYEVIAHTDAVFDGDLLAQFIQAYQSVSVLTIGELWAFPIMLRLALIENLRRLATANLAVKESRSAAEELVDDVLGKEDLAGTDILLNLAAHIKQHPELLQSGAAHMLRRLRGKGLKAALTQQWIEQRLREGGIDPEELMRREHHDHAANQISTGNTVTSLKAVSSYNWRGWFESTSRVHTILSQDPAGIYERSDFQTRDRCRQTIEKLSRRCSQSEIEISETVKRLAANHIDGPDLRLAHVGYYLVDRGLVDLEKTLGARVPWYLKGLRFLARHAAHFYLGAILALTLCLIFYCAVTVTTLGTSGPIYILFVLLVLVPSSQLASDLAQWVITHLTKPFVLPKLDFEGGIPDQHRTLVAVHALFTDKESIQRAIDLLEVRYLANEDPNLFFSILGDLADAPQANMPGDRDLIQFTESQIAALNKRYVKSGDAMRFFILFRKRVWNEAQNCFMAWERKRGKVTELNRLISGAEDTTFSNVVAELPTLRSIKYVITLDGDSQLPRGTARRMIEALAHPLNRPVYDPAARRIVQGYGIIQPRVGVSLTSANVSRFSRIFAGNAGLDPYTSTVSDVYQDVFGEGSFVGKAIYDVQAFEQAMHDKVPDNALLSHDLFEGIFVRVALATDIELLDEFPSKPHVHARRQHRWTRGDWQLLPWLFSRVPDQSGKKYSTAVTNLGWWKLFDNLRRSLVAPSLFLFLLLAWLALPQWKAFWDLLVILVIAFPVYANLANALMMPPLGLILSVYVRGLGRDLFKHSIQALLSISFLPYQAFSNTHAILVTLYRMYLSKRNLLEWETASHSERRLGSDFGSIGSQMLSGVTLAAIAHALVFYLAPHSMSYAAPFLFLWYLSPIFAWWVSQPISHAGRDVSALQRSYLKVAAWDTWRFFETLMNERNNYLIPDNIQLIPNRIIAERTSPTNIGLALLGTIAAHDLGFLPLSSVINRLSLTFATLAKLERYKGHFLNWYQTATLQSLYPRYVSHVDSGNFVANVVAARVSFNEFVHVPLRTERHWQHVAYLLGLVEEAFEKSGRAIPNEFKTLERKLASPGSGFDHLNACLHSVGGVVQLLKEHGGWRAAIDCETKADSIVYELQELSQLRQLFAWYEPLSQFVAVIKAQAVRETAAARSQFERRVKSVLTILDGRPLTLSLLTKVHRRLGAVLRGFSEEHVGQRPPPEVETIVADLERGLTSSIKAVEELIEKNNRLIESSTEIIESPDFGFLYDGRKNLFVIGYNVDDARRDGSFYDLLASEARVSSLFAIAQGQVPQKHWFALGRNLTDSPGGKCLLSWSGTMFEYLMPILITRNYPNTILSETYNAVVRAQELYGRKRSVPWGVSESGYSGVDFEKTYQYRAFGVPGLGLKRGLSEDLVVSPYSSFLALPLAPHSVLKNVEVLERSGGRGEFGFYEALDYTTERLSSEEECHVVRSFLAHHQGMTLISISNFLLDGIFQERFHSDPIIKATELLLQERFPDRVPAIVPHQAELSLLEDEESDHRVSRGEQLFTPHTRYPRTRILSNGRYSVMVDNVGSGWSFLDRDVSLTRWREDLVRNDYGYYIFVRDRDTGKVWSVAYQPTKVEPETYEVIFNPDKVEFKRRDFGIALQTEITISPEENVEVRRVTVKNLSGKPRSIELTSFAEVVLGKTRADSAHPAFAKMFIESEYVQDFDALLFARRPRGLHDEKMFLLHMCSMSVVWDKVQYETSRSEFIGRGCTIADPLALNAGRKLQGSVGAVLDPIFAMRVRIELEPWASESAAFITAVANNKDQLLQVARRYHEVPAVTRAFEMAWSQSSVELRHEQITIAQTHVFQRLANCILFNIPEVRGDAEQLTRNRLQQSGFWRFGVSGDFPIVLCRVSDPSQMKTVQELLLAHWYLRLRGLTFDLVILNEYPGGYLQTFHEELEALIRHGYSAGFAEKNGGVFLRKLGQLGEDEVNLVCAFARVVVNGTKGPLGPQLETNGEELAHQRPRKNLFSYIKQSKFGHYKPELEGVEFFNQLGGFTDEGRSYSLIIRDKVLPPLPWSNIVANPRFGFMVTETGGGYTWSENSRENRITPWSNDPIVDPCGEAIFIRDTESGSYWSATPAPASAGESYRVKHGFGFSEFETSVEGIASKLTISGAIEDQVKWWTLHIKNQGQEERDIELLLYADWTLGIQREDSVRHIISEFDPLSRTLSAVNHYNNEFAGRFVVVGSDHEVSTFTTSREEFVGRNRDLAAPFALESAMTSRLANLMRVDKDPIKLSGKTGAGFDSCAVIAVQLTLKPGTSENVLFFIAESASAETRKADALKYRSLERARGELERVRQEWNSLASAIQVKTPERSFDIIMNGWLLYQCLSCRVYGRSAFYQSGGAFGFRDQLQDTLAMLVARPALVRQQIILHAGRQFVEGDVQHWWHPPTGRGVRTRISDDYLWLPYLVHKYIESTSDQTILEEEANFIEGPHLEENQHESYIVPHISTHRGSIYEHCIIALDRAMRFGSHGLPLIGCGDWNDGMNEVGSEGKGESVWLGWFLYDVLMKFAGIVEERNDSYRSNEYRSKAQQIREAIESQAWDGAWYTRAFFDNGTPLGSSKNDECKIDSISQSWGIISQAANPERAKQAMQNVYRELVDAENGLIRLLFPPFNTSEPRPGYIAGYLPGIRENGAQYTHAATWVVMATAMLGEGDRAFDLFNMINPVNHGRTAKEVGRYQGEPYVTCGDVYSTPPYAGRAGWSWYTGSAAWLYLVGLEHILGIKIRGDHFIVDPCVPKSWRSFEIDLSLRGNKYHIVVVNAGGCQKGVSSVEVQGQPVPDRKIRLGGAAQISGPIEVRVTMG
ncbi:MAG: hypothetical protein K1X83_07285 [Oligoflexia bacterium]|nr:hypothetical protein [Oligoflexia bacterium]